MRKLMIVGLALCFFTVFVSSASACFGPDCIDGFNPIQPVSPVAPIQITTGSSVSNAAGSAVANSQWPGICPTAEFQVGSGVQNTGTYAYGTAASAWGGASGVNGATTTGFNFIGK